MSTSKLWSGRVLPLAGAALLVAALAAFVNVSGVVEKPAQAANVDYFLKLDGVEGESADDKHKGEIELLSYSWGKDRPGIQQEGAVSPGGGGGAGKATFADFHFKTQVSKASPQLMLATANGKHIKEAVLTVRKGSKAQQDFYKVTFKDVLVSSYQTSSQDGSLPTDQFSLNYGSVELQYSQQKSDGSLDSPVRAGWDVKANRQL